MAVQTKYYIIANGFTLKADFTPNTTGDADLAGYYSSHAEIDAALAANGTVGVVYTIGLFKEVTE